MADGQAEEATLQMNPSEHRLFIAKNPFMFYSVETASAPRLPQEDLSRQRRISRALQTADTSFFLDNLIANEIGWRKTGSVNA